MAELSDADKKILMGDDYKRAEAQRDASRGITDQTRLAKAREDTASNIISLSIGVGLLAFVIGLANYNSHGTPYNASLVLGCVVVVVASAALAIWFMWQRKSGAIRTL